MRGVSTILDAIMGERPICFACEYCEQTQCAGCVFAKTETLDPELDCVDFIEQIQK